MCCSIPVSTTQHCQPPVQYATCFSALVTTFDNQSFSLICLEFRACLLSMWTMRVFSKNVCCLDRKTFWDQIPPPGPLQLRLSKIPGICLGSYAPFPMNVLDNAEQNNIHQKIFVGLWFVQEFAIFQPCSYCCHFLHGVSLPTIFPSTGSLLT